jgi:hypothetical protein
MGFPQFRSTRWVWSTEACPWQVPLIIKDATIPPWRCASGSTSREGTVLEDDPAAPCDPNVTPMEQPEARELQSGASKVCTSACLNMRFSVK